MSRIYFTYFCFIICLQGILIKKINAQQAGNTVVKVEKWDRFEMVLPAKIIGNPFTDVTLSATFKHGSTSIEVKGFYDGNSIYKIRFMPVDTGLWLLTTKSNNKQLSVKKGSFYCTPSANVYNHGPVKVWDTYNFKYADGTVYYPFGTTIYAWTHQPMWLQDTTLATLRQSPFNKLRFCVFPKDYSYVKNEPPLFPYEKKQALAGGTKWDFTMFNPLFFQHLERRIQDLEKAGIEADLILFHPYDKGRWGFDSMGRENDLRYLEYIMARLSSYRNVWWSMANEYDFVKSKTKEDWLLYSKTVHEQDPYNHLCSIHNGSVLFENWLPYFSHASIQIGAAVEDFGRANLLRDAYLKPVIYDEVCYEGNLPLRWGRLSGEEMVHAFWQSIISGTYATHGETYLNKDSIVFWAKGGKLVGTSVTRIQFLKMLLDKGPGPLHLADEWKDVSTAQYDSTYYLIYFGKNLASEWLFNIPKKGASATGTKFRAEIIDTWDMKITPVVDTFQLNNPVDYRIMDKNLKKIRLPLKPYMAIRLIKVK